MIETTRGQVNDVETLIVGAGFGGIAMVDRLLREDPRADYLVLERADEVGGTWRDNTYPGCACDVPTALYSLSHHPQPEWAHSFGRHYEIQAYLRGVADTLGMRERLVTGCTVTGAAWDADSARWTVSTSKGTVSARFLAAATGALSTPSVPDLPGLESFAGETFHSAAWRHDLPLEGRRIAVVGTGASALQFVPEIVKTAGHVTVFQRTPGWVLPRLDRRIGTSRRDLYRRFPAAQRLVRSRVYVGREVYVVAFTRAMWLLPAVETMAKAFLSAQVRDPAMRKALTPDFSIGCKRILLSSKWFPALTRPDATLVPSAAARVTPTGVVAADGSEHEADVIVFGTGFQPTAPPVARILTGGDGRTLQEVWGGGPHARLGVTVPGFPNLFLLYGPNTNLGHSSIIYMLESQADHVARLQALARKGDRGTIEVREEAESAFNRDIDERLSGSVWNTGGCQSYFFDETGRNSLQWPRFTFRYRQATKDVRAEDFVVS